MKKIPLLMPAVLGLACGLTIRALNHHRPPAESMPPMPMALHPAGDDSTNGNPEENAASALSASDFTVQALSSRAAEEAAVLRLLQAGASAEAIEAGIALLNASISLLASSGENQFNYYYWHSLFQAWVAGTPEAALAAAGKIHNAQARSLLVRMVFESEALANGPDVLTKAMDLSDPTSRQAALTGVAHTADHTSAPALLRKWLEMACQRRQGSTFRSFPYEVFQVLAREDASAPLRLAISFPDPNERNPLLKAALEWFAESSREDPSALPAVLSELVKDPGQAPALSQTFADLISRQPEEALRLLRTMPESPEKAALMANTARSRVAESFRPGVEQPETVKARLDGLYKLFSDQHLEREFHNALIHEAMRTTAAHLRLSAEWLAAHSPTAVDHLTRLAADRVPVLTSEWLAELPASPDRDRAVALFAEVHAIEDLERALRWAESISDPTLREVTLARMRAPESAAP